MGSTNEADRKRRHFSSMSPTAAGAKRQPFAFFTSEDKKLDAAVLKYQNQKLIQKLETQKIEILQLEEKIAKLSEKQLPYENIVEGVRQSWEKIVDDLESYSTRAKDLASCEQGVEDLLQRDTADPPYSEGCSSNDFGSSKNITEVDLVSRPPVTDTTEGSCSSSSASPERENNLKDSKRVRRALQAIVAAITGQILLKDKFYNAVANETPGDEGLCKQKSFLDLQKEVQQVRVAFSDLYSKHKSLACELQEHKDREVSNKAQLKYLEEELDSTCTELEDNARELANLKAENDPMKGTPFPILDWNNMVTNRDNARDKQKDLQDLESSLKELLDQSICRMDELKCLHEERKNILKQLFIVQNTLKNVKSICSSKAYLLLKDQLAKVKADIVRYQALQEKLQLEKENLAWREKEMQMKIEWLDLNNRSAAIANTRISELEKEMQKCGTEKTQMEANLEDALREPGRNEVSTEFKALVSSFPEEMSLMKSQLSSYKDTAKDIHALRADMKSLSGILEQKVRDLDKLSTRSTGQVSDSQRLQSLINDLKESDEELKLFLRMYNRESVTSREVTEARDSEFKAWANIQSLKTSLDEHNLELRVKAAIEAEATSQQRLAATEAEIAELRQKREASKREGSKLADTLKFKQEETEAYVSEIETIGQAYDDMQTQNQQLLQQITERDDYNIKLVLEGAKSKQAGRSLLKEKQSAEREIEQGNSSVEFYNNKVAKFEDQLKLCSDQVHRLAENRVRSKLSLENNQKKVVDARRSAQQLRENIDESQSKVDKSRMSLAEMQMELERDRFERKRKEEELEAQRAKTAHLKAHKEGSSALDKLRQEDKEFLEILKCSVCVDRRKEVVIAKCYHLFCNPCIQRVAGSRHRKCPKCGVSFNANDVKPVYI